MMMMKNVLDSRIDSGAAACEVDTLPTELSHLTNTNPGRFARGSFRPCCRGGSIRPY